MASDAKRTRGPNRKEPWVRRPEDGVAVLRLSLEVHDPVQRRRLEGLYRGPSRCAGRCSELPGTG